VPAARTAVDDAKTVIAKTKTVIAGLNPAIHLPSRKVLAKMMDARVKPAHDGGESGRAFSPTRVRLV
jgi:hypothetical protein